MAFAIRELSAQSYSNAFTLWHYRSSDPLFDLGRDGFFNEAADMIATGDMMLVSAPDGGAMFFLVSKEKVVTVTAMARTARSVDGSAEAKAA